ncbi:MAG: PilZ domain-containing protein [Proteobacteria bacterium]|nr:PilZ domain-containing protein [Pseudomonadota bacterium]
MISNESELRSDVRGDFSYTVEYEIITPEEFHSIREKTFRPLNPDMEKLKIGRARSDNDNMDAGFVINDNMAEFFVRMDEKLDRILLMLSKNEVFSGCSGQGTGNNISASGMNICIDRPVKQGQIVHANIVLSKLPFFCIDVYGEIIRIDALKEKDAPLCQVGIKFLNLDEIGREKIVAYIFQQQREAIRKSKNAADQ